MSGETTAVDSVTNDEATLSLPPPSSSSSPSPPSSWAASYASLPPIPCPWLPSFSGHVLQGTCGWTDASILKGRHFYPSHVHTAVDRLRHYSSVFPCVEVDSSNYAIPPPSRVASWVAATPPSFLFHFKVYGLFTSLNIRSDAIPGPLRDYLPSSAASGGTVQLSALPPAFTSLLWQYWNAAVLPAHAGEKMGLTVFQFHLNFSPSAEHRRHVEWCREQLWRGYRMAVEFRNRKWVDETQLENTRQWLTSMDITLICEDDLAQETYRPNKEKVGEDHGLPIIYTSTSSHSLYVRLHRRVGDNRGDRVLKPHEFTEWAQRFIEQRKQEGGAGRAQFMMWGTDCWDDPVVNAKQLDRAMKESDVWWDWAALQKERSRGQEGGNLLALFQKQTQKQTEKQKRTAGEGDAAVSNGDGEEVKEGETPGGEEVEKEATSTPSTSPTAATHQKRSLTESSTADAALPAVKKPRLQPSPARGVNAKMTAKERQIRAVKGNISSFFTSAAPR